MTTTHAVLLLTAAGPVLHSRHGSAPAARSAFDRLRRGGVAAAVMQVDGGRARLLSSFGLDPVAAAAEGDAWRAAALAVVRGGLPAALAERVRRERPRLRLHDAGEG